MANYSINTLELSGDKHIVTLPYGVCATAADTAAKAVTVDTKDSAFELVAGAAVLVKFTYDNNVASSTLNVNGTGAKPIYRYGSTAGSTGDSTSGWRAGAVQLFVYDGTGWIRQFWENSTYSNVALGQGYATCGTAAATVAKTASLSSYALTAGGIVSIKFTNGNTVANPTLNINSKGAKAIYYRGAALTDTSLIQPGDTVTMMYSTQYHIIAIDHSLTTLKNAVVFKGTLGTGGTITALPTAAAGTVGDMYKVITAGTYASIAAKVGDVFVCSDAPAWVLIPSGDEVDTNTAHSHGDGVGLIRSGGGGTTGTVTYKAALVNETKSSNAASYTAGGSSKFYAVQLDKNGKLGAYVPWANTTYTAGTGLTLSGTEFKVTTADASVIINLLGEGTSPSQLDDYIVAQYAGGGTTTTTYHRRKLRNILGLPNDGTKFLNGAGA